MATYYVAKTGNDSNPGTLVSPKLTFTAGIALLSPGDTLLIRAGTYDDYFDGRAGHKDASAVSGTLGAPITVAAYPGTCFTPGIVGPGTDCETVILRPTSQVDAVLSMGTGSDQYNGGLQYWTFNGLRLNAAAAYQGVNAGSNNTFTNMDVFGMNLDNFRPTEGGIGFFIQSERVGILIDNTKIHDGTNNPGPFGVGSLGLYWQGSSSTLQNSEVYNFGGFGMQLYCNVGGDTCTGGMSNNTVKNNSIHNTGSVGGLGTLAIEARSQPGALPHKIYNNIIYNNGGRGIGVRSQGSSGHVVYSNTVYGNASAGISINAGTGHVIKNNIVWNNDTANTGLGNIYNDGVGGSATFSNNLQTNPLFTNAAGADFTLTPFSPAINAGTTNIASGITISDFFGSAPDIGALEFGEPTPFNYQVGFTVAAKTAIVASPVIAVTKAFSLAAKTLMDVHSNFNDSSFFDDSQASAAAKGALTFGTPKKGLHITITV